MSIETYQFNLPITPGAIPPVLHLSQYDSGRTFTAILRDDANVPFELDSGATAVIKGRNAAGIAWQQDCSVSGANVTFTPSGAATDQFGVMPVTIEITESEEVISPLCVIFHIQKAGYTNEEAVLSPDFETAIQAAVAQAISEGGLSFSDEFKEALLDWCAHTAWDDTDGEDRYAALEAALYPDVNLVSITAAYDQDRPILDTNSLDLVKLDLVVTANYSDGTTETLADDAYELSGTLTAGTSTITVSYGGKTDEISVTVKHNYASELSNFRLTGNSDTTYADGVISLKCSTSTQYNNYSQWAADLKGTTLWDDVNGKTLKVRIYSKGVNFGEYSDANKIIIGVFAFKDATITSTSADKRKGTSLYSYAPTEQYGWTEDTVVCDLSQFGTGTLTPTSASTFGVQITSRSYATVQIADVEVYEV